VGGKPAPRATRCLPFSTLCVCECVCVCVNVCVCVCERVCEAPRDILLQACLYLFSATLSLRSEGSEARGLQSLSRFPERSNDSRTGKLSSSHTLILFSGAPGCRM
jgi:hypothetical protein